MHAASLVGENLGDEQPLIDLEARFGALLQQRPFLVDPLAGRQQRRIAAGCRRQQLGHAQAAGAMIGQFVVDRGGVKPEEVLFHGAGARFQRRCFVSPVVRARGLQAGLDVNEILAGGLGVARKRRAESRLGGSRRG